MGNPNPNHSTRFKPGQSGNPGGKPVGARNTLTGDFVRALSEDFAIHGKETIETVRQSDPSTYVRVIASMLPKEVVIERPLEGLSDEELGAAIAELRARLASASGAGSGTKAAAKPKQAGELPTIQ